MKLSLRTRLIVLSVAIVTLALLALALANFLTVRQHLTDAVHAQSRQLVAAQSATLGDWVQTRRQLTHTLTQAVNQPQPEAVVRALRDGGGFTDAYIGYADKRMVFLNEMPPGYDATARPWYQQAVQAGKPILTAPYRFVSPPALGVTFAEPVGPAGNPIAVVGTDVPLTTVVATVGAIRPTPDSFAFLADQGGTIITHSDEALTLQPVSALSPSLGGGTLQGLAQASEGLPATIQDHDYLLYGQMVPGTDWQLVVAVRREQALAAMSTLLKVSVVTALVALLVAIVLLGAAMRRTLRRLGQVRDALDDIAQGEGDLSRRLNTAGHDELASIAGAFNRFTQKIAAALRDIRSASQSVRLSAAEIAQGNQALSSRTEAQAAALEQTAAAMVQLSETVRHNAERARHADGLATEAATAARAGGDTVQQVVQTMHAIEGASSRVTEIVGVIDSIAFQTNILALNAAVESARAGEQGRGFAVVASEVRALAQRSASAAREIKGLIEDSVTQVRAGAVLVDTAGGQIEALVGSVGQVRTLVGEISAASQEQTQGMAEVAQAVAQMDSATQQNAAQVEEVSASAQALSDEANQLDAVVSRFTLEPAGGGASDVWQAPAVSQVGALRRPQLPGA